MSQTVVRQRIGPTANANRRTWYEHLLVRLPIRIVQGGNVLVLRLDLRSRLRKALVALAVQRGWAAAQREDWAVLRPLYADDVEFRIETAEGDPVVGLTADARGFDAVVAAFDEMLPTFDGMEYRIFEVLDAGDWCVALMTAQAQARTSGIEVDIDMAQVYDMREGVIARQRAYYSWQVGLDTVGLGHIADELDRDRKGAPSPTTR